MPYFDCSYIYENEAHEAHEAGFLSHAVSIVRFTYVSFPTIDIVDIDSINQSINAEALAKFLMRWSVVLILSKQESF